MRCAQLIVGVHRMFYCDSSDFSSNDNGDQTMAARQRAALESVFNYYKARPCRMCYALACGLQDVEWHAICNAAKLRTQVAARD